MPDSTVNSIVVGIDPGFKGAFAFMSGNGDLLALHPMPTIDLVKTKKSPKTGKMVKSVKQKLDINRIVSLLKPLQNTPRVHIFLEEVHARHGEGVVSTATFARGCGVLEGVIVALGLPYTEIPPTVWTKIVKVRGGKDGSRARASQLFPYWANQFAKESQDGNADAALIAMAGTTYNLV